MVRLLLNTCNFKIILIKILCKIWQKYVSIEVSTKVEFIHRMGLILGSPTEWDVYVQLYTCFK